MISATLQGEKVQVGQVEKITGFHPLLYEKDYGVEAATFRFKSIYLIKGLQ